jgi:hypothetical protein
MPTGERRRGRQRRGIWWEAEAAIARELERRGKQDSERTIHGAVGRSLKVLLLPRARGTAQYSMRTIAQFPRVKKFTARIINTRRNLFLVALYACKYVGFKRRNASA